MAFINNKGMAVSYECSELIAELEQDILEFGDDKLVSVWCKDREGVTIYVNYDLAMQSEIDTSELESDEYIQEMTTSKLMELLKQQNKII